jgi:hypothetical protein
MNKGLFYVHTGEPTATPRTAGRNGINPLVQPLSEPAATQAPAMDIARWEETGNDSSLECRFRDLVRQWKGATALTSSITEMATHPAYQQIIGMGKEAIPLILEELQREPDHWFWALKAITGEDPVSPADRGKLQRMAQAWLCWAKSQRY